MKRRFDYTLYLVTDSALMSTDTLEEAVGQAIQGGCTLIQLREKDISSRDFYELALRIKKITDSYNVPLIINDRIDIALAIDAGGVHLGQSDIPAVKARAMIGNDKILGISVSTLTEAVQAEQDGADYVGVGAMFATGTKTDAVMVGRPELVRITEKIKIPTVVIGGINEKVLPYFDDIAIDGIAVVSAVISQKDIRSSAENIKRLFNQNRRPPVRNIDAAIFDLDGTLLDSMDLWQRIDIEFLNKRGFEVPEHFINEMCARSFVEAAEYTIKRFGLNERPEDLIAEWDRMALYEYSHKIKVKPHAVKYLEEIKKAGIRLAVATSLPKRLYEPALKNNGIYELFDVFCSVDEVARGKENPDVFELAIKRLGCKPQNCIIFEDVLPAVKSAKKTGAYVCGVCDEYSNDFADAIQKTADWYIKDFTIAPIIKK